MSAILNSLNAHNLPIFQPILMILVSKFMVLRALSDTSYLSLGLLSPLTKKFVQKIVNFSYPSVFICFGCSEEPLSTNNICFG